MISFVSDIDRMPPCKNDPAKTYAGTEPSPKGLGHCAHAEAEGTVMQGRDERTWAVKLDKNGVKSWKPVPLGQTFTATPSDKGVGEYVTYVLKTKEPDGSVSIRSIDGLQKVKNGPVHENVDYNTFKVVPTVVPAGYRKTGTPTDWMQEFAFGTKRFMTKVPRSELSKRKGKLCWTHDNGGIAYAVYVGKTETAVYERPRDEAYRSMDWGPSMAENEGFYSSLVGKFKHVRAFIPKGPDAPEGNSVLLQIATQKYVLVHNRVVEFTLPGDEKIVSFESPVWGSDVSYPVARTDKGRFLILWDDMIVKSADYADQDAYMAASNKARKSRPAKTIGVKLKVRVLSERAG
jgi:hypothetical protein